MPLRPRAVRPGVFLSLRPSLVQYNRSSREDSTLMTDVLLSLTGVTKTVKTPFSRRPGFKVGPLDL